MLYTLACESTISVSRSPASICHCQTHQSQCSPSPPTLKSRRIHSLSLFFSHKIVTRGPLKSRNCTRKRLAAWLCPDPLEELECSPRPLAAIWVPTSKGREGEGGKGRREEGKGKGKRKGKGSVKGAPLFVQVYAPVYICYINYWNYTCILFIFVSTFTS